MTNDWKTTTLSEVLVPVSRPEVIDPTKEYPLLGIRLDGGGPFHRETKLGSGIAARTLFKVRTGDFIYSRLFAWRGAFGIIRSDLNGCYVSGEFPTFKANPDKLDVKFLQFWFRLPMTISKVQAVCTGSTPLTRNRFKEEFFLPMEVSLPSLSEQRRIVARIEQLAAQVHEARALRCETLGAGEAMWSSTLAVAFMPPIDSGPNSPETATALLQRQSERYASDPKNVYNNAHPWTPQIYTAGPYELPSHWVWTDLGSILVALVDCVNDTPEFADAPTGLYGLKSTNVRPYKLDLSKRWFMTSEDFTRWNRREPPRSGDLVLTREAPMGYVCILPDQLEVSLTQRLMLLRTDNEFVGNRYILHFLNSPHFRGQVLDRCRGLTTPHIRVKDVPSFLVPLPPREEQHQVVDRLDTLQAKCAALTQLHGETAVELDALLPSILDKAFRGELLAIDGHTTCS